VATQALFLLNSSFVRQQAGHVARQILSQASVNDAERIQFVYRRILNREATPAELDRVQRFLEEYRATLASTKQPKTDVTPAAWQAFVQALYASAEFRYLN
jgi:hypothetical protein